MVLIAALFCSVSTWARVTSANTNADNIAGIIEQVEKYYQLDKELVPYDEVLTLSTKVLPERQLFTTDTIAKTYFLLADAATRKADIAKAFQFATYGLELVNIDHLLRLKFLQKLMEGYYVNGQFKKTLDVSSQTAALAKKPEHIQYLLVALGYRAMANALLGDRENANKDIDTVTELMQINDFNEDTDLLAVLSLAYFHLDQFEAVVDMQSQLIGIKLNKANKYNIDQNYFTLARAYEALGRFDDAYNAFWNAQKIAEEKSAVVLLGYIELGLGKMLINQEKYQQAYESLIKAEQYFIGQNQRKPHLSVLMYLAKVSQLLGRVEDNHAFLIKAEQLAQDIDVTKAQIQLYQQLHDFYKAQSNYKKALALLNQYHQLYLRFNVNEPADSVTQHAFTVNEEKQVLASRLVTDGQLKTSFERKYHKQYKIIILLTIIVLLLALMSVMLWLKTRTLRLVTHYNENERPIDFIYNPNQTKNLYQSNYKKARKYNYSLAIGYITVDNWKELSFQTNKKVLNDVARAIATLINQSVGEFDYVGMLNESEYLLLCPHQNNEDIQKKLEKLVAALEVNYFANLGGSAVSIEYSFDTPTVQDIDPYIFLSRLSERVSAEFVN